MRQGAAQPRSRARGGPHLVITRQPDGASIVVTAVVGTRVLRCIGRDEQSQSLWVRAWASTSAGVSGQARD
jgi:hypothetical protein